MFHPGCVIWLTGLSGAGKTTLGEGLHQWVKSMGIPTVLLDGDEVRKKTPQLGFSEEDRKKHVINVAKLAADYEKKQNVVIVCLISPFEESREWAKSHISRFVEVFVSTPLEVCEDRDPKGLYKKARSGEIEQFTGISQSYESPPNPDFVIDTSKANPDTCLEWLTSYLMREGYVRVKQSA